MRLSLRNAACLVALAGIVACSKGDPDQASTWIPQLSNQDSRKQIQAIDNLRRIKDPEAVPALLPLLRESAVQAHALRALKEIADASSVAHFVEAIDFDVGAGEHPSVKAANAANKNIAEILGDLGDKSAVDSLMRLAERSRDPFVRAAAVESLGRLGDAKAVPVLMKVATNEDEDTYVNKKAVEALGHIGDPSAAPAIQKMLFHERRGVSFYPEASFAAFQIGKAMSEPLIAVLEGRDEELNKWADDNDIYREALYAKAAQVLADLGERSIIPTLVRYLNYTRPGTENIPDVTNYIVRRQAADALARLRAREGVTGLIRGLKEPEGNIRKVYADALVAIGDRRALPALVACSLEGEMMDKSAHARTGCYVALSRLGDESSLKQWERWEQAEPGQSSAACMRQMRWSDPKGKEAAQAHCDALGEAVAKVLKENKSRLVAYGECKDDVDCWIGKLKDGDPKVRERAATELGRLGDDKAIGPLMAALNDKDNEARGAAIMATDWLVTNSEKALAEAKKGLEQLDAQLEEEKGRVQFARVNEDLVRLAVKLRRLGTEG